MTVTHWQSSRAVAARQGRGWVSARVADRAFVGIAGLFAAGIVGLVLLIAFELARSSTLAWDTFGVQFLTSTRWDPVARRFGALPYIYGTIVSSLLALLIGAPLGLGAAIFLSELAPRWMRAPVSFLIEMLASIPSVVYGLWALFVLVPIVRQLIEPALGDTLGRVLPLFQGPPYGVGMLSAGLVLAIMILPTIAAISRDVLLAVPRDQREGLLALGATRWEVISTVVLPYARAGILGAVILGLGRALGETMAVTMVIGNRGEISGSLFALADTMASVIANQFTEASYPLYLSALVELGLVLFGVTILLNVIARWLVWRVSGGTVVRRPT
ncbi:MAG: phosphate ABC transporter permease subunit PstC [Chloroflexi bacterium]|nr:phosphate ABC transporter permease subunit PstC [Chloroflexota bacterium]MBV9546632.1 phosphate ABC transporter permease subunit PstC [Chloroflexota bacterium]